MPHKKLLLVEDDPKSLYAFRAVLQTRGFEVVAYDSAEAACEDRNDHFTAAIVDVRLPKMQGTDLARWLRQMHPSMRIIFVTAFDGVKEIEAAIEGSTVLLKPIDIEILLKLL